MECKAKIIVKRPGGRFRTVYCVLKQGHARGNGDKMHKGSFAGTNVFWDVI